MQAVEKEVGVVSVRPPTVGVSLERGSRMAADEGWAKIPRHAAQPHSRNTCSTVEKWRTEEHAPWPRSTPPRLATLRLDHVCRGVEAHPPRLLGARHVQRLQEQQKVAAPQLE